MPSNLGDQLRAIAERKKAAMETVVRSTVLKMATEMVKSSPVGNAELWAANEFVMYQRETHNLFVDAMNADAAITGASRTRRMGKKKLKETYKLKAGAGYVGGRFRSNWQYGADTINYDTSRPPDPSGNAALGAIQMGIASWKPGQTIFVTNALPYAQRLETGWSKQAPSGMVAVTLANFQASFASALGEARSA